MKIDTIRIREQELRYVITGDEDASETMLVFNGIGASLDTLNSFASHFKNTRIVSFDVPGVGGSPAPLIPYRFSWLARLTAKFLDALGIDRVHVFGVSWGGAAAQQFTYDYQHRVITMTLAATAAGVVMVPGNIRVLSKMATPKRYVDPTYMLEIGPEIYGGQLRFNTELLEEHASALKSSSQRGYFYQLMCAAGWTSWLFLPQIKVPSLVIMGADDPIVPVSNGRILTSRLPDARMEVVDCGHLFMLTDPKGSAEMVEDFIHAHVKADAA